MSGRDSNPGRRDVQAVHKPTRVRHVRSGHLGELIRVQAVTGWALVRWDDGGPGLVNDDGLSYVSPGLLSTVAPG